MANTWASKQGAKLKKGEHTYVCMYIHTHTRTHTHPLKEPVYFASNSGIFTGFPSHIRGKIRKIHASQGTLTHIHDAKHI